MQEVPLAGGTHGPVTRIGDTVRREARASTPAVHALLRHLERSGFDGAPKALGFDERGREILSFIPGDVVGQRGAEPAPAYVRDVATLIDVGRLLRRFHDATVGFTPPSNFQWEFQVGAPRDGDVVCHNDIGPWNIVFVEGRARAFIDFDTAAPAPREWDIAYALYRFVPFVPDKVCTLVGWGEPPDRPARTRAFCDAYGLPDRRAILDVMIRRIEVLIATGVARNAAGDPRQGDEWLQVIKPRLLRDIAFIRTQRPD
jgi:Ser/Thr protein kinase RdoA (MazF antagonist)